MRVTATWTEEMPWSSKFREGDRIELLDGLELVVVRTTLSDFMGPETVTMADASDHRVQKFLADES